VQFNFRNAVGAFVVLFLTSPFEIDSAEASNAEPTTAQEKCDAVEAPPEVTIAGCTDLIEVLSESQGERTMLLLKRGFAYLRAGALDEAAKDFEAVLLVDPEAGPALFSLATIHELKGDFDLAIETYSKLTQRKGRLASVAVLRRGRVYLKLGQFASAHADFTKVVETGPRSPVAIIDRAVTLLAVGKVDDAMADFERSLRLDADMTLKHCLEAWAYLDPADQPIAVQRFRAALQPGDPLQRCIE
jgi:tetratricopeptide (TPR) repeat protein